MRNQAIRSMKVKELHPILARLILEEARGISKDHKRDAHILETDLRSVFFWEKSQMGMEFWAGVHATPVDKINQWVTDWNQNPRIHVYNYIKINMKLDGII